ncbi:MAG: hypothetical protein R3C12_20440 [Planctomycetaceae bacterium]
MLRRRTGGRLKGILGKSHEFFRTAASFWYITVQDWVGILKMRAARGGTGQQQVLRWQGMSIVAAARVFPAMQSEALTPVALTRTINIEFTRLKIDVDINFGTDLAASIGAWAENRVE